ncbi:MAG TPA: S-adenosylmethionine decarboxylase [archaeon]|nr:S-adenosylmethionine decarboxylase [archaeon]
MKTWKNLAPNLVRQRLMMEGTTEKIVEPEQIKSYLVELAKFTKMEIIKRDLPNPIAYSAHECGYGGWIHWKTSGAHFYSYPTNPPLFTVDTYTCKPFSVKAAVEFTKKYFNAIELVWKEVEV